MNENQIYTNGTDVGVYTNNCAVGCTAGCGLLCGGSCIATGGTAVAVGSALATGGGATGGAALG